MRLTISIVIVVHCLLLAGAGELEPQGPPAPTMITLEEISDKLDSIPASGLRIQKTGQIECWGFGGAPIPCIGSGQDGEYKAGISVSPRFTDNDDGTVKDSLTGLIWLKNATCLGVFPDWLAALEGANTLENGVCGLTDGSVAGDWRMPNLKEMASIMAYGQYNPTLPIGHPFVNVQTGYWVSDTYPGNLQNAYRVFLDSGTISTDGKSADYRVWPIRDDQEES